MAAIVNKHYCPSLCVFWLQISKHFLSLTHLEDFAELAEVCVLQVLCNIILFPGEHFHIQLFFDCSFKKYMSMLHFHSCWMNTTSFLWLVICSYLKKKTCSAAQSHLHCKFYRNTFISPWSCLFCADQSILYYTFAVLAACCSLGFWITSKTWIITLSIALATGMDTIWLLDTCYSG